MHKQIDKHIGHRLWPLVLLAGLALGPGQALAQDSPAAATVRAAEQAFADSMKARDFQAFAAHVAEDAVFFNGDQPLRGKAAVLAAWKGFFEGAAAPFSWKPRLVEVLPSGSLAYSSGPVAGPDGQVRQHYASTWRLDDDGRWRVVLDRGYAVCPPPARAQAASH